MHISIISDCNNNCEYCFQKNYHNEHKLMTIDEYKEILKWGFSDDNITLYGGEPTLHPEFTKFIDVAKEFYKGRKLDLLILTNLLCKTEVLEKILEYDNLHFLINTTSRDELKDLFHKNMELINANIKDLEKKNYTISLGITLTADDNLNKKYIDNIFSYFEEFPDVSHVLRLGLATPCPDEEFEIVNFEQWIRYILNKLQNGFDHINLGFDCPTNNCQIKPRLMAELLENPKVNGLKFAGFPCATFDILVDGSLRYCASCPDDFLRVKSYKMFRNNMDATAWFNNRIDRYIKREIRTIETHECLLCKGSCRNTICNGLCPAIHATLMKQLNERKL